MCRLEMSAAVSEDEDSDCRSEGGSSAEDAGEGGIRGRGELCICI